MSSELIEKPLTQKEFQIRIDSLFDEKFGNLKKYRTLIMLLQISTCALLVAINQICFRIAGFALQNGSTAVTTVMAVVGVLIAAT